VTTAASAFPADFYATAATVIPVFFLAFAVQGRAYRALVATAIRYSRPFLIKQTLRSFAVAVPGAALIALAAFIIIETFAGELIALIALMDESAAPSAQTAVLSSVVVLLIGVIVPPASAMIRAYAGMARQVWISASEEQPSTPDRQAEERAGSQGDNAEDDPADALQQEQSPTAAAAERRPAARPAGAAKARGRGLLAGLRRRAAPPP
jgi:hypothetical protein